MGKVLHEAVHVLNAAMAMKKAGEGKEEEAEKKKKKKKSIAAALKQT